MSEADCIFCKIVRGELPSARVYEDDGVVAFLDINPMTPGHALVVPRRHYENLLDAPEDVVAAALLAARRVAPCLLEAVGGEGFNLIQFNGACAGQEVMHLHLHIIPRHPNDDVVFAWQLRSYGEGEMDALAAKIREAIG